MKSFTIDLPDSHLDTLSKIYCDLPKIYKIKKPVKAEIKPLTLVQKTSHLKFINRRGCCGICGERKIGNLVGLDCRHFFHKDCLDPWFQINNLLSCPMCRKTHQWNGFTRIL